MVRWF